MPKAKTETIKKTSRKTAPKSRPKTVSKKRALLSVVSNIKNLKKNLTDPKNRKNLFIAGGIFIVLVLLYLGRGFLVAATVNGQPVSRIAVISELEKQSGQVVLENLITKMLVMQEAKKNNVNVTEEDVNKEIDKISKQFKEQGQDLNELLRAQGLSQEKFKDEVKIQLLVTKLLGDKAKVSDKEFEEFMTRNPGLIQEEENQEKARETLRTQLEQQKLAQKYQEWMMKLKKEAKINYFVNY